MTKRNRLLTVAAAVALAGVVAWAWVNRGVRLVVTNSGTQTMKDVRVRHSDGVHALGDVRPGHSQRLRLHSNGSSALSLSYTDPSNGRVRALDASGVYIGPGVGGRIVIDQADRDLKSIAWNVSLWTP